MKYIILIFWVFTGTFRAYSQTLLLDNAREIGEVQRQMQLKYEKNNEKVSEVSDEFYKVLKILNRRSKEKTLLSSEQIKYVVDVITIMNKTKLNLTDNVGVNNYVRFLNNAIEEIESWTFD
ncbi:hypothetical protein EWU23_09675 [Cytophagaceae bacterium 50C-KIRBA]|uniref:TerB family tellurite resistance protein n=1 Tax=Aquirufa beregesia TaxID=2516556 RepID=A0ABX0EXF5_9BACT|nr:hypothetical protein [Aquirufa beregesia]NGZ44746.1 hypothetical protein [Aquirufa beregesia]